MGFDDGEEELTGRRRFLLRGMTAALGALLTLPVAGLMLGPVYRRRQNGKTWIEAGKVSELTGAEPARITYAVLDDMGAAEERVAFVIPSEAGPPVALSPVCPHAGCQVAWLAEKRQFLCPCHQGVFDAKGKNVSGPPRRPLDRLMTKTENGVLYIQGSSQ